jgi:hypothetical protein
MGAFSRHSISRVTYLLATYDEEINRMEKSEVELQVFTRYKELAGWFLFPALVLLAIDMVLRYTWFRTLP